MSVHPRFKTGLLPTDPAKPILALDRALTGVMPAMPAIEDRYVRVTFALDGNDVFSTCGPTSVDNNRRSTSKVATGVQRSAALSDVYTLYRQSGNPNFVPNPNNPVQDEGVEIGTMLDALLKYGLGGDKPIAFGRVNDMSDEAIERLVAIFGGVLFAVTLDTAQQAQSDAASPVWDYKQSGVWGGHCLAPGTKVLTDDLRWVPIESLEVGQSLMGFDEFADTTKPGGPRRHMRTSTVEATELIELPCYDLEFDDGSVVRCSDDHLWLTLDKGNNGKWAWRRTDELQLEGQPDGRYRASVVAKCFERTWEQDESRDGGYLAAAFDGEGWLDGEAKRAIHKAGFSQRENPMMERVETALLERDYRYTEYLRTASGFTHKPIRDLVINTSKSNLARFLGEVRPHRLLAKFSPERFGCLIPIRTKLVGMRPVGTQTVVAVQTSSRTFIADGFAAHNCVYCGKYRVLGPGHVDAPVISWAKEIGTTDPFRSNQLDEVWVVIWPWHLEHPAFLEGVDVAELAVAFKDLTGKVLPVPSPTPTPTPQPPPIAWIKADEDLWAATKSWSEARHCGANRRAAQAVKAWAAAKNFPQ